MGILDIILIGIGLSMDAAAVSMSNGISASKIKFKTALIIALFFGFFQGFMPFLGYIAGSTFSVLISNVDHWVAFVLLLIIGGKMLFDSLKSHGDCEPKFITLKLLFVQAIATSIDALAVGVTFSSVNLRVHIWVAVCLIAAITFLISLISVYLGKRFGCYLESKAGLLGGVILIGIGVKILVEHLFF